MYINQKETIPIFVLTSIGLSLIYFKFYENDIKSNKHLKEIFKLKHINKYNNNKYNNNKFTNKDFENERLEKEHNKFTNKDFENERLENSILLLCEF